MKIKQIIIACFLATFSMANDIKMQQTPSSPSSEQTPLITQTETPSEGIKKSIIQGTLIATGFISSAALISFGIITSNVNSKQLSSEIYCSKTPNGTLYPPHISYFGDPCKYPTGFPCDSVSKTLVGTGLCTQEQIGIYGMIASATVFAITGGLTLLYNKFWNK